MNHPTSIDLESLRLENPEQKARREKLEALERLKERHATAEERYHVAMYRLERAAGQFEEAKEEFLRAQKEQQRTCSELIKAVEERLVKGTIET